MLKKQVNFKINVNQDVETRIDTLDGVEHLVVPVVAVRETVMNGLLYPKEEIEASLLGWEGVPVPVNHPSENGMFVSARGVRVHENYNVGRLFNVYMDSDKLKGEIWVDKEKAKKIRYSDVVEALENKQMMEVSIGLYCSVENVKGEFNGEQYSGIARNYLPDHLALLPNTEGACSIEKGCGAVRANCGGNTSCGCQTKKKEPLFNRIIQTLIGKLGLTTNDMSYNQVMSAVGMALQKQEGDYVYLVDLYDGYLVFESFAGGQSRYFKQEYSILNGKVILASNKEEVVRNVSYEPIQDIKLNNEETKNVTKDELIAKVIANSENSLGQEDKEALDSLPETTLEKLAGSAEPVQEQTTEDVIANIKNPVLKEFLSNVVKEAEVSKLNLIEDIKANSTFTEEELKAFNMEQLQKIKANCIKPNYSANAGAGLQNTQSFRGNTRYEVIKAEQKNKNGGN